MVGDSKARAHDRLRRLRHPWTEWFEGKDFSADYVSNHMMNWRTLLPDEERERISDALEVGSFEGRSAVAWLNHMPNCRLTCLDKFTNAERSARFDRNVADFGARVRKVPAWSHAGLCMLAREGQSYDFIYVDGSHRRDDVMADCILSWPLLRVGGMLLLDDYAFEPHQPPALRPKDAIDVFLNWHAQELDVIHLGYQVAVRRTA